MADIDSFDLTELEEIIEQRDTQLPDMLLMKYLHDHAMEIRDRLARLDEAERAAHFLPACFDMGVRVSDGVRIGCGRCAVCRVRIAVGGDGWVFEHGVEPPTPKQRREATEAAQRLADRGPGWPEDGC